MADPQAAQLTQLRNIQTRTGKSIADLHHLSLIHISESTRPY